MFYPQRQQNYYLPSEYALRNLPGGRQFTSDEVDYERCRGTTSPISMRQRQKYDMKLYPGEMHPEMGGRVMPPRFDSYEGGAQMPLMPQVMAALYPYVQQSGMHYGAHAQTPRMYESHGAPMQIDALI